MHILSSRIITAFLEIPVQRLKVLCSCLVPSATFFVLSKQCQWGAWCEGKKKKKKRMVADTQRCQALLIETSRSQAEKQRERAPEQFRLSRVLLCYSLTHCAILCVCVCVRFSRPLPLSRSCKVALPSASRQSLSRSLSPSAHSRCLRGFFFFSISKV